MIRDREILARDGFMIVSINVDSKGKVVGDPEIISRGFVYLRDSDDLLRNVRDTVNNVMRSMNGSSDGRRRDKLEESISRVLYNETKRRPMVFSIVNEV